MKTLGNRLPINWPYVLFVVLTSAAAIGFIVWEIMAQVYRPCAHGLPMSGGWNWPLVLVLDTGCLLSLSALFWNIYCDANTEFGDAELSRPSILGVQRIGWPEIVRIERVGFGYHIFSKNKKIVLSPYIYRDPDSVISILRSRLPGDKGNDNQHNS